MKRIEGFPPATIEDWRALVEGGPKPTPIDKLHTPLEDGIVARPLYTRRDREGAADAGLPGVPPWIRGARARPEAWEVRQIVDLPEVAQAAAQARAEIEKGATALRIRLGPDGVAISSAEELAMVLEGVPASTPIVLDAGKDFARAAAWLQAVWAERKLAPGDARGSFGADPLGAFAATGAAPDWEGLLRIAKEAQAFPEVRALRVSAAPYHEAGATAPQEMAAALSTAVSYLRRLVEGGFSLEEAARQIVLEIPVGPDVFWEIAKLRAMRWTWGRALRATGVEAAPRIEAITSRRMMTARDPWVNLLRTTAAAFAAVIGGAESLEVRPFDAALGLSDEFARRLARNIQRILQDESQLHHVIDPAGGSYYLESLTEELARRAWERFQALEGEGGIEEALRRGKIQGEIAAEEARRESLVARRALPITGLSEFPNLGEELPSREPRPEPPPPEPGIQVLRPKSLGSAFERLRDASDEHLRTRGSRPFVFLAKLGKLADHNARATWISNLLAAGGIEGRGEGGHSSGDDLASAFKASGAKVAVICGSDAGYESLAEDAARSLRAAGAQKVLLAGRPGENETGFREAGVDGFIYAGQDAVEVLGSLLHTLGVALVEAER